MKALNARKSQLEEEGRIRFMRETAQNRIQEETAILKEREKRMAEEQRESQHLIDQLRTKVSTLEAEKQIRDFKGLVETFGNNQSVEGT